MSDLHDNPPWVAKTVADNWAVLSQQKGGAEWMPSLEHPKVVRGGRLQMDLEELGCGVYGCVLETNDPDVVMKITTDVTEAEFVTKVIPSLRGTPEGLARYFGATKLSGTIKGHRAVALWRESASVVGLGEVKPKIADRIRGLMHHQHKIADAIFVILQSARSPGSLWTQALRYAGEAKHPPVDPRKSPPWKQMVGQRPEGKALASLLEYWRAVLFELDTTDELHEVATALLTLLRKGILMADVHEGNVGLVKREGRKKPVWVITDPGHTVVLPSGWPAA